MADQLANVTELENGFDALGFSQGESRLLRFLVLAFTVTRLASSLFVRYAQVDNSFVLMSRGTTRPPCATSSRSALNTWGSRISRSAARLTCSAWLLAPRRAEACMENGLKSTSFRYVLFTHFSPVLIMSCRARF